MIRGKQDHNEIYEPNRIYQIQNVNKILGFILWNFKGYLNPYLDKPEPKKKNMKETIDLSGKRHFYKAEWEEPA